MRRNFIDVIGCSFRTFMSSIWGLVGSWWLAIIMIVGVSYLSSHVFHIPWSQLQTNNYHQLSAPILIIDLVIYLILTIFMLWQVQIINSNISFGETRFFYSLKTAFLKSWKYIIACILSGIVFGIIYCVILIPLMFIFAKNPSTSGKLIIVVGLQIINILLMPFGFTFLMGSILDDIGLLQVIKRFFKVALENYFTLIFSLIYIVLVTIGFYLIATFSVIIFRKFGFIFMFLGMFLYFSYILCYLTETYLNLDANNIVPEHEDIEILDITPIEKDQIDEQTFRSNPIEGMSRLGDDHPENK
ncbi:MAG: hypothetical protein K6E94_01190 [Elusimicrobiaceae bacterium]|nr:hypothetical protein [Elusimicrobiaceae bacterium]